MKLFSAPAVRLAAVLAVCALSFSCTNASINGVLENTSGSQLVVKQLDMNKYSSVDTLKTGTDGSFSYKLKVQNGQPEFVYFYYNDVKVASALLSAGDRIKIKADTLGNFTVEGSEESSKLAQVEKDYTEFYVKAMGISAAMDRLKQDSQEYVDLNRALAKEYISYYRSRVKYVLDNVHSLTVVPVLLQSVGDMPVFAQSTDAIIFKSVSDSLSTVYPDSKYVRFLAQEAKSREKTLDLEYRIRNTEASGYPDIELPDVNGKRVKLSEVEASAKVVLLHFWSIQDDGQKVFNLEYFKPLYEQYHSKGLEIYQIAFDPDKSAWASVVKGQGLEWVNVCDIRAGSSPVAGTWNVPAVPVTFVLSKGEVVPYGDVKDAEGLTRLVASLLSE